MQGGEGVCLQVKEGIVGRMRSGVPGSLSPLRPPTRTRPHGPPHPSRARESKVSTAGENRMILKTDREIKEPRDAQADLGPSGQGFILIFFCFALLRLKYIIGGAIDKWTSGPYLLIGGVPWTN